MPDLLIEPFSEESPARKKARAAEHTKKLVTTGAL